MAKRTDTDLSNSIFCKQSTCATSASSSSDLRSFLTSHALRFRSDSYHIKRLRAGNENSYLRARQHNAVLAQLRKTVSARLNTIHGPGSSTRLLFRDQQCPPVTKSSSCPAQPKCPSAHSILESFQSLHKKLTKEAFSKSKRCCSGRYEDARASMNTHRTLHVYLDAIDTIQSEFRRVRWVKARDNLIKMSTLPVLTFRSDQASPGKGVVSFSDRLLHAAHLEDLLDRLIAKQEYILSEAKINLLHPRSDFDSTDSLAVHDELAYGKTLNPTNPCRSTTFHARSTTSP